MRKFRSAYGWVAPIRSIAHGWFGSVRHACEALKLHRITAAGLVLLGAALGGCTSDPIDFALLSLHPPNPDAGVQATVPHTLAPPAGNAVALVLVASGDQNYECRATNGKYAWAGTAPQARLYALDHRLVGHHDDRDVWKYEDGSQVSAKLVIQVAASTPDSLSQALYRATSTSAPGVLADVTYIQRVHTIGGQAPTQTCNGASAGIQHKSGYSADYVFFKASQSQNLPHQVQ